MDLNFRLFRTHVRVSPFFWLGTLLLGWRFLMSRNPVTGSGLGDVAIWIGCVFVSILLHEFGHVLAFRWFGHDAHIVLHGFGGLAIPNGEPYYRWQRIVVAAAGPAIQLLLYGAIRGALYAGWRPPLNPVFLLILVLLLQINLWWPILNLLPIWPLDGGRISREVCTWFNPVRGVLVSLWLSLILCAVLAVHCVLGDQNPPIELVPGLSRYFRGDTFMAIWFALFAAGSYQAIQAETAHRRPWDDDLPWER
jgi:Zn-dependent protease